MLAYKRLYLNSELLARVLILSRFKEKGGDLTTRTFFHLTCIQV